MDWKRSTLKFKTVKIYGDVLLGFLLICIIQISSAVTDPTDVAALNSLYASLGSPPLPGWVASGGDPCGEGWQGIQCNGSFIQKIVLNGANLGGELGDNLATFVTISVIDLSNNNIGGSIPSNLPVTMRNFFLSANLFTGSIPASLSTLIGMTDMSLNNNHLTGEIPDAFQSLTQLINLDLSSNNLSGELPPSVENLSSLTTLRLQDNQLSGTLDVLQDLPLKDLNVENNQFAGPIPPKLLNIPTFRQAGNPFNDNATEPSAPPPGSQVPPPPGAPVSGAPVSGAPSSVNGVPSSVNGVPSSGSGVPSSGSGSGSGSGRVPTKQADGPTVATESKFGRSKKHTKRVVLISIASVLVFVIFVLALVLFVPRCGRRERVDRRSRQRQIGAYGGERQNARDYEAVVVQPPIGTEKVPPTVDVLRPKDDHQEEPRRVWAVPNAQDKQEKDVQRMVAIPKSRDQEIDISTPEVYSMPLPPPPPPPPPPSPPPPPPPPPHPLPTKRVIAEPTTSHRATNVNPSLRSSILPPTFAKSFTIASLQQYTNSFSQENLIGGGMLGTVYRAELPDGKLLAVKKFDKRASTHHKDDEFLELVNNIDRIRHSNIVELIGYCSEHGQRLLIFEYCSNGSLYDALHSDEELKAALSWNTRIRIALGAARALEYLHEQCQPPVIHRNLKSANILLDEDLSVRLSDCGLAPLIASGSVSQLSGNLQSTYGYGAPEFELGTYNYQSDIYTFGVIMLELLTGRQSHDRTRPRGEQFLARWAIPKLHDIDALLKMVDPSLNGVFPAKSLSNFADIISRCLQLEPEYRPAMSEVVLYLLNMIKRESEASDSNEK